MHRFIGIISLFCLFGGNLIGQSLWRPASAYDMDQLGVEAYVTPAKSLMYSLNFDQMVQKLKSGDGVEINLPAPDGTWMTFKSAFSPAAEAAYYARYPQTGTYRIVDPANPANLGKVDHTILGFHAYFTLNGRTVMIDPIFRGNTTYYSVYYQDEYFDGAPDFKFHCDVHDELEEHIDIEFLEESFLTPVAALRSAPINLKQYRLAVATTGEYYNANGGNIPAVSAEIITAINRVNSILERDVASQLILVANNDTLIFTNSTTDPYTNGDTQAMINENPPAVNARIGVLNYDIGHVFGTNAGGLAQLSSICTNAKARGVTSAGQLKFDAFYVRYVGHEVGHQFSATHTMNKCDNQNETPATAWEPGSGSTIMSYFGLCGTNNVTPNTPGDYYHGGNITQMTNFVLNGNGNNCGTDVPTSNEPPTVNYEYSSGFFIPISTPFKLSAQGEDLNPEDLLTYCWEQVNTGPITDAGDPVGNSPLFRSWEPTADSIRYFPRLPSVVLGLTNKFEYLPDYSRDLAFQVTVRDNNSEAGATARRSVFFRSDEAAGPFTVTSFSSVDTVYQGDYVEITWDVANTDQAPVNCKLVNIRLSINGGTDFPFYLAENVPNNGSFFVSIPPVFTTSGRIMVEAADNIFFNTNTRNLRILEPASPRFGMEVAPYNQIACIPNDIGVIIKVDSVLGFDQEVTLSVVEGLPPGATVTFSENPVVPPAEVTMSINTEGVIGGGLFNILIAGESAGIEIAERPFTVNLFSTDYSTLDAISPASGSSGIGPNPQLSWIEQPDAESYTIQVATSPSFGASIVDQQVGVTAIQYTVSTPLNDNTLYYWRVIPVNICGEAQDVPVFAFHTATLSCGELTNNTVLTIPAQGIHQLSSPVDVNVSGDVSAIRIKSFKGNHANIGHLRANLESPLGTKVKLWSFKCSFQGGTMNFGINDESPTAFSCPPNTGLTYKSEELLSTFNGEPLMGTWKLNIDDLTSGSGGQVDEWTLEFCSNVVLNPPAFIRNDELVLKPSATKGIGSNLLLVADPDNTDEELVFTLVRTPSKGNLLLDGAILFVGDSFTQEDVNTSLLSYAHLGTEEESDNFLFTVQDGAGGWLGIDQFSIRTDESVSILRPDFITESLLIWPNPTSATAYIQLSGIDLKNAQISVYNEIGQIQNVSAQLTRDDQFAIQTENLLSGFYFVVINHQNGVATGKLRIVR